MTADKVQLLVCLVGEFCPAIVADTQLVASATKGPDGRGGFLVASSESPFPHTQHHRESGDAVGGV